MSSDDLSRSLALLSKEVAELVQQLGIAEAEQQMTAIIAQQQDPSFWNNTLKAQQIMQRLNKLSQKVQPWRELEASIAEVDELQKLGDASLAGDLNQTVMNLQTTFSELKKQALYNQPYDDHDAIISIFAGAGGTDAQDWAQMLLRMYSRWAEQNGYKITLLQEAAGEEAGIKSATLACSGPLAYGKLKGEHGVHRLVRLSPFNADNLRQTSFAKVDVLPMIDAPDEVDIDEKDIKIDVYRAGGHGGQSVNTTDSAVRVTHIPTAITVAIQNERSQQQNKETALTILRSRLAQLQLEQHTATIKELKGPNEQAAWGNQIRNYVLHPYTMAKDTRTKVETSDTQSVLDGNLNDFIEAYLESAIM